MPRGEGVHPVARLTSGLPISVDLAEMGGHDHVVVVHGATASDLRDELSKVVPPEELAKITATVDQLQAMERDVAKRGDGGRR